MSCSEVTNEIGKRHPKVQTLEWEHRSTGCNVGERELGTTSVAASLSNSVSSLGGGQATCFIVFFLECELQIKGNKVHGKTGDRGLSKLDCVTSLQIRIFCRPHGAGLPAWVTWVERGFACPKVQTPLESQPRVWHRMLPSSQGPRSASPALFSFTLS